MDVHFLFKVAIVKFDICEFYILASNESPQFTHAVVPYYIRKGHIKSHGLVRNSGEWHELFRVHIYYVISLTTILNEVVLAFVAQSA